MKIENLKFLIQYVSSISPELWKSTMTYIHAAAIQWSVGAGLLYAMTLFMAVWYTKEEDEIKPIPFVVGLFALVFAIGCTVAAIGRFNAPEWYSIKFLLLQSNN
jgi:hypothetical protein